ncbi:MAG: T9SS type A sorting domain-containing protein [Cytophagales bacterium]|nr:T9SS type A sorting domain-containing protein [Cytophagales bacterium]MCA6365669.1 T9SS type A sorting domain-containing protein [Cytophagales bacterium]MCA6370407.1 T9SS type A sorting domain-containing protein [Cytophagales bacterium]MCA6375605.1 T9SS type A sorting domain-containing protein [Cytophagales bacterium]MCA6385179.1 T9SS type A sorting domain-containing protein [Cytophagales bacterium]
MLRRIVLFVVGGLLFSLGGNAQVVTTVPAFPVPNQPVTITIDVAGTTNGLENFAWDNNTNPVYLWTWIPPRTGIPTFDAPTNVNPATAAAAPAKMNRVAGNNNKYEITITPTLFFGKPASEIPRIGVLAKNIDFSRKSGVDKFIDFSTGFNASFASPTESSFFKNKDDQIPITVNASESATLTIKVNGSTVSSQAGATTLSYTHTVTETSGTTQVTCEAVAGAQSKTIGFSYTIRSTTVTQPRPSGLKDGINYSADPTKATLCLWAPGKSSVYVIGDFTNWDINANYLMKKDGERFWLEITGLTSGVEYAFQYLVDESLRIADPYTDKVLDPDDSFIPAATYPSLKTFPSKAVSDKWYFNRLAVLQTGQTPYVWQVANFQKPAKEKLVIYELLVRDFFGSNGRNYQNLIDTLAYFKRLGVNAIELMPFTEFNGNESWGYNPTFMFAPDKYYGTKSKLKEFIDKCHQNGIAVILDMVMNHHDVPNPYVMMDFDFTAFKPTANNKWFNTDARHPFNVFFDMNHESSYTKKYLDTVNHYWLNEYKIDGYRYDLSKGFTQTNNPSNVGAWGAYDASRIALLKRMSDKIWSHTPNAYVMLEHFADNSEEKELAEYKASEGKGMMLWSGFHGAFGQSTKGESSNTDISGIYFANRGWTVAHNIGYMESHDEERLMYGNLQSGRSNGSYNIKTLGTALDRIKAASLIFYSIPGPKMLWQFGELGYEFSINTCQDLSVNSNCRVSPKPVKWEYRLDPARKSLYDVTADLIKLRKTHTVFTNGDATVGSGSGFVKQVSIKNKPFNSAPTTTATMNVVAVANFDVTVQSPQVTFSHTGTWYDYYGGGQTITVGSTSFTIELQPGQYKLYTDVNIGGAQVVTGTEENDELAIQLFPNPTNNILKIEAPEQIISVSLVSTQGNKLPLTRIDNTSWDVASIATGLYIAEIRTEGGLVRKRVIKK